MATPSLHARFAPAAHVEFRAVDGGGLLVDVNSGACFRLNRVGADLWSALTTGRPLLGAIESLGSRYDAAPETIASDALALCEQLTAAGLLCEDTAGR